MAAIDKIYGNAKEYDELRGWASMAEPYILGWFYPKRVQGTTVQPITNFPEEVDMWLLLNCPIDWVLERIVDQYGWTSPRRRLCVYQGVAKFHWRRMLWRMSKRFRDGRRI